MKIIKEVQADAAAVIRELHSKGPSPEFRRTALIVQNTERAARAQAHSLGLGLAMLLRLRNRTR